MYSINTTLFFCWISALVGLSSTIKCIEQYNDPFEGLSNQTSDECKYRDGDPKKEFQFCFKTFFPGNGSLIERGCGDFLCSFIGNGCKETSKDTYETCCCDTDNCNDAPSLFHRYSIIVIVVLIAAVSI
jgi:hypothetical protein